MEKQVEVSASNRTQGRNPLPGLLVLEQTTPSVKDLPISLNT
jgi:hypothetical protein